MGLRTATPFGRRRADQRSSTKATHTSACLHPKLPGSKPCHHQAIVMGWRPRLAREEDIPPLETLIPISVRALQAHQYSPAQMEAALGPIFGVDRQLIRDGTYFVVERDDQIVCCGGWSTRESLFRGDSGRSGEDGLVNPECDR